MNVKKTFYILGLVITFLSPFTINSENRFYPFLGIALGGLLIYLSKNKEESKKYLKIMKFMGAFHFFVLSNVESQFDEYFVSNWDSTLLFKNNFPEKRKNEMHPNLIDLILN